MARSARSIRVRSGMLAALAALLLSTAAAPAGAAEQARPATVWDAMPKGTGYTCTTDSSRADSSQFRYIDCVRYLWGQRGTDSKLSSYLVGDFGTVPCDDTCETPSTGNPIYSVSVMTKSDPYMYGSFCDKGGSGFDPVCQAEKRSGKRIPDSLRISKSVLWPADSASVSLAPGGPPGGMMGWLAKGEWLMSPNGRYGMTFQPDGNLVAYGPNSRVLWNSGTWGHPQANFTLQPDGNAVIYDADGSVLWSSKTAGNPLAALSVQNDGNAVIYKGYLERQEGGVGVARDTSKAKPLWWSGWDKQR